MSNTNRLHMTQNHLPGPGDFPLIGRASAFIRLTQDAIAFLPKHYTHYGAFSRLTPGALGRGSAVVAIGPQYNQQVLSDPALFYSVSIGDSQRTALERLNSGLLNMNGIKHQQQRRLLMPTFHKRMVETYAGSIVTLTDSLLNTWQIGDLRNISQDMRLLMSQLINQVLFGIEGATQNGLSGLIEQWMRDIVSPGKLIFPVGRRQLEGLSADLERGLRAIIDHKRAAPGQDVLSMLLLAQDETGSTLTDTDLIGHTVLLFAAGHETTASALTWIFFLLATHPIIAEDLSAELSTNLHDTPPIADQLPRLTLLDAVIKESMRLFPPLAFAIRLTHEPVVMGGWEIPKDTGVVVSHYLTHRQPDLYPQPKHFKPQRWEVFNPSPYEYLPFSAGPRLCIGATLATTAIKLVLATILQRYRLSLPDGTRVDRRKTGILAPKKPLFMRVNDTQTSYTVAQVVGDVRTLLEF